MYKFVIYLNFFISGKNKSGKKQIHVKEKIGISLNKLFNNCVHNTFQIDMRTLFHYLYM